MRHSTRRKREKTVKLAVAAGHAEGGTALNAFDNALLAAGIGNINLLRISSIVPPEADLVELPAIRPGALVPAAYVSIESATPGQIISAAVGLGLPVDPAQPGVIMEFSGVGDRAAAEATVRQMVEEAFRVRQSAVREVRVAATEHRVERLGCAVAAALLLTDDLLA